MMFVFFVLLEAIAICDQITIISVGAKILISRCIDVMQEEVGTVVNFPIWPIFCSERDFVCTCSVHHLQLQTYEFCGDISYVIWQPFRSPSNLSFGTVAIKPFGSSL